MSHYSQPVKGSVFIQHAKVAPFTSLTNLQDQDLSKILDKASLVVVRTMRENILGWLKTLFGFSETAYGKTQMNFLTNAIARMILWLHNYMDG